MLSKFYDLLMYLKVHMREDDKLVITMGHEKRKRHKILVQMTYIRTMGNFKLAKGGIINSNYLSLWSF